VEPEGEEVFEAVMRKRIMDKRRELGHTERAVPAAGADAADPDAHRTEKEARKREKEARKKEKEEREAARRAREAERLKRMGMAKAAAELDAGLFTAGEVKRREIKSKKAVTADREAQTLAKLGAFPLWISQQHLSQRLSRHACARGTLALVLTSAICILQPASQVPSRAGRRRTAGSERAARSRPGWPRRRHGRGALSCGGALL